MLGTTKRVLVDLFFIGCLVLYSKPAYAYLDPGSGSALVGVLFAALGAVWYTIKTFFYRIAGLKDDAQDTHSPKNTLVLFSEGRAYWGTFRPIVEELISRKIYFRYRTLDLFDPALEIESPYMNSKRCSRSIFGLKELSHIEAPVMVSTSPNIGAKNYFLKKSNMVGNLVHIFHHVGDISTYKKFSLDKYDTVIMAGPFQEKSIRSIEKRRNLKPKRLISLGLPYLDELYKNRNPSVLKQDKTTILIGSSWGPKGCLKAYGISFIKALLEQGYNVIVRPHPHSRIAEPEFIDQCKKELETFDNFKWDDEISPNYSMSISDILISDTSSIRFDFAFIYEKPVISLQISAKDLVGFEAEDLDEFWDDEAASQIGVSIAPNEIGKLGEIIKSVLEQQSSKNISSFRDRCVTNFGNSSPSIIQYLPDLVQK
ncbi:CDP-glycerol glycerophosphotransferase family protein [Sneathiella marina]|uniref:CDP-glycerol glycerophosphotransferase family protein n=1 Tax=Sneathiella marina TaxID=2950108 RepID=A0ABY4W576_9PROT|nr:CDP-glycerol glycerophosphotransferase family protein [Sneathiella marina]USG61996.1 CDP-glycerol glycerophosphotransferase family protein [Sneathiella marina]